MIEMAGGGGRKDSLFPCKYSIYKGDYQLNPPPPQPTTIDGQRSPTEEFTPEEADELRERISNFRAIQEKVWLELYDDFENGTVIDDLINDSSD